MFYPLFIMFSKRNHAFNSRYNNDTLRDKALLRSYFSGHFGALQDLSVRPEICPFPPQKLEIPRKLSDTKLREIHIKVTTNAREENRTSKARI